MLSGEGGGSVFLSRAWSFVHRGADAKGNVPASPCWAPRSRLSAVHLQCLTHIHCVSVWDTRTPPPVGSRGEEWTKHQPASRAMSQRSGLCKAQGGGRALSWTGSREPGAGSQKLGACPPASSSSAHPPLSVWGRCVPAVSPAAVLTTRSEQEA